MRIHGKLLSLVSMIGILGGGASVAYAACDGVVCRSVKVERLYVRDDPSILVSTDLVSTDDDETKLNRQPIENRYIELRASHTKHDELYSMLLAAKLADHDICIRVRNAPVSPCLILYAVLE